MTYAQYLQQFVGKTGSLRGLQFSLGNGSYEIKFVGTDFIQISGYATVFVSDTDITIPLNVFILKAS